MIRDMKSNHTLRIFFLMLALLAGAGNQAWADVTAENIIFNPASPEGGTVGVAKDANEQDLIEHITTGDNQGWKVTIFVTPDASHEVDIDDIVVVKLLDPSLAQTRSTETQYPIADKLTVIKEDGENDNYSFVIPEGYGGAQVTVTFTIKDTTPDLSGIYYLQSKGDSKYYMIPSATEIESGKPYVQTGQNRKLEAVWKLEKVAPNSYHIIHYNNGSKVSRHMIADRNSEENTVWLETVADPSTLGDNAVFVITENAENAGYYNIKPKGAANADGKDYLNVKGGNKDNHTIGLSTANDNNSLWKRIDVPAAPTISVSDIKASFTNVFGAGNIHYTYGHKLSEVSDPTKSSPKASSVTLKYGPEYYVKAVCIYTDPISETDWISGVTKSSKIQVNLLPPIFSRSGNNVTISNSQSSGVKFLYTFLADDDGREPEDPIKPNDDGTLVNGDVYSSSSPLPLTAEKRNVFKAIAYNNVDGKTYTNTEGVITFVVDLRGTSEITKLSQITEVYGAYKLLNDVTYSSENKPGVTTFSGVLDGGGHTISGLEEPLFTTLSTGTVRNVNLSGVSIAQNGAVGAVACTANGNSRIYNVGILSGSLKSSGTSSAEDGTDCCGGIVGLLDGYARVINCFSYAEIKGGNRVGGIVGYNNYSTTSSDIRTMVMNCMFYGDITGGNSKAPIYNGKIITNRGDQSGVSNFNYFRLEAPYVQPTGVTYNCALGAEDRFLNRFEFYRHLLNSHRELAAWWATGAMANKDLMYKWVMEPEQIGSGTPYPILKTPGRYRSVVYIDDLQIDETHIGRSSTTGSAMNTLAVTIEMGSGGAQFGPPTGAEITTSSLTLNITDKDPDHYNFNYYKVQLPYYNDVGTKNYTGNRVVTGWKIVSITGGTQGSFKTGDYATVDANGNITESAYNFADRNCTDKDKYSVSGRVFNQGAYWDVPEGVTAITIQPYWAKCAYLADPNADKVYNKEMGTGYDVPNVGGGQIYTNGNSYPIAGENQVVFTDKGKAIATSNSGLFQGASGSSGHTVYDYAVVLVGNYHFYSDLDADMSKPYTVTSIDLDGDNEPDYSYILRFDSRKKVHPVRVDFINIPGLGMAQKSNEGTGSYNFGIMQPRGWFESTNTSLFRETQFEYDNTDRIEAPYILQGGVMEQWVNGQSGGAVNKTTYFHVGGNVWFKEFHRGTHQDYSLVSKHPPVSVTGGDFDEFYLTGLYKAVTTQNDDAECYISGGRFGIVAGTGMEGIGDATNHTNGNITWQISYADIKEFYGGGINAKSPVQGNITTNISGSHVKTFCGGPKFGDMWTGRTVKTTATNCEFGTYFGAGYGGSSYSRQTPYNYNNKMNIEWNQWVKGEIKAENDNNFNGYKRDYKKVTSGNRGIFEGVSTQFSYQFLPMSGNKDNCARLYIDYVMFSLATTHGITSNLTGCTVTGNFYGGGSLGKVEGDVTSTLDGCAVLGNVFGAGFSANLPPVEVDSIGFRIEPYYYEALGTYRTGVKGKTTTYTWEQNSTMTNPVGIDTDNHILYTKENLAKDNLGSVDGDVILTIKGNSKIGTDGDTSGTKGNVFGGGESSYVTGDTHKVTVNLQGNTEVLGNVFGGGDKGVVQGSVEVNIEQ